MDSVLNGKCKLPPPPSSCINNQSNSMVLSIYGDMIFIDNDNNIKLYWIRHKDDDSYHDLPLDNKNDIDIIKSKKYTNLLYNNDGTLLLLSSKEDIDIIEVIREYDGHITKCKYHQLNATRKLNPILKVAFHPWSINHIIILQEKANGQRQSLFVMDTMTLETVDIVLENYKKDNHFVSFCFGPSLDFLAVTILLTTSKGNIYALCPVLPSGSFIPRSHVHDMKSWVDEVISRNSPQDSFSKRYTKTCKKYMKEAFPVDSSNDTNVVVGGTNNVDVTTYIADESMLAIRPTLQGPFSVTNSNAGRSTDRDATDICIPNKTSPVIAISYTNGDIDYLMFSLSSETMHVMVAPSWEDDDHHLKSSLSLIETVSIGDSSSNKMLLSLLSDPLNVHCIYAIDRNDSSCYMILSQWMLDAVAGEESNANNIQVASVQVPLYKDNDTSKICCGVIIAFDPIIGHGAFIRFSSGCISFINLSTHLRICEFQNSVNKIDNKKQISKPDPHKSRQMKLIESEKKLVADVEHGLATFKLDDKNKSKEPSEALMIASEYFEQKLILPLEQLFQLLNIRVQNLKETRDVQNDDVHNILQKINDLNNRQSKNVDRINRINEKFEKLKGDSEQLYSFLLKCKTKVSQTERDYKKQLRDWNYSVKRMADTADSLTSAMTRIKKSSEHTTTSSSYEDRPHSTFISPVRGVVESPMKSPMNGMPMPPRTPLTAAKSATKSWSTPFSPLFSIENRSFGSGNTPLSSQRFTNTISDDLIPHCKDFLEKQGNMIDQAKKDVKELLDRFDNSNM